MPGPTSGALARYCRPSNIPAAVAAAFLPPKSIDAAPPIMPCAPLMKNEVTGSRRAAGQGQGPVDP